MPSLGLLCSEGLGSEHPTLRLSWNSPVIRLCLQSGIHTPILTPFCAEQGAPKPTVALVLPCVLWLAPQRLGRAYSDRQGH